MQMQIGKFNAYRGHTGTINYDPGEDLYYGRVEDIPEIISYTSKNGTNLYKAFTKAVDEYVDNKDRIEAAKKLLAQHNYIVKKWTKSMEHDVNDCEKMLANGRHKDCGDCCCSVCLAE